MNEKILAVLSFLPKYEEIQHLIPTPNEAHYILQMASENVQCIVLEGKQSQGIDLSSPDIEEASFLVEALAEQYNELVNIGILSDVPLDIRKIYTISLYYKICYDLISSHDQRQLEKCRESLESALFIGYPKDISSYCDQYIECLMEFLDKNLNKSQQINLPFIEPIEHQDIACDIPILQCPSIADFNINHFVPLKPALLRGTINDWPALSKWRDLTYILKVAGNRSVPIEIGPNYTTDNWSQQLVKISDFLKLQFSDYPTNQQPDVQYLAQHELFDYVPVLKEDIRCPVYCSLGKEPNMVDIKAWLGPKGTISPLHQDLKHNILCQVFGMKRIILASPDESELLYPHEMKLLQNTSQINAENLDFDKFPLARRARFYHLILQEGECLYLPPKWWHYVRAETKSFSVSFWWE